ncbi:Alpha/Beta hydrolase protein [Mycena galopus ATCC 62051]|nr:Alpha/Beta hydrolase protein [Mycena galopus ATCC 62051]
MPLTLPWPLAVYSSPQRPPESPLEPKSPIKQLQPRSNITQTQASRPRLRSWGIEMTLITSFMRGAGRHSALVDIRRQLRGILADLDAQETGKRELSGEWVVGRRTWQRLQAEWQQRRAAAAAASPTEKPIPEKKRERVVLYIHGGAFFLSSAASQRLISIPLSKYTDARVFALDYRLAPETRFPGPLHDAVSAYVRLVEDLHIPPENIIVCGDSAGGGLSLALLMYCATTHLTMSCESWDSNEAFDVVPVPTAANHMNPIALYLGDGVEQYLTHPYASPLFGDFTGLPPMLIQAGDAEVLRDEIALLAHKATLAGVEVRHELYEDAVHIFQIMHEFVRAIQSRPGAAAAGALGAQAEAGLAREIDTADATVVRGDGVESAAVKEDLEEEERTESEPEEEAPARPGLVRKTTYYPSWGPSRLAIASPPSTDTEDDETDPAVSTLRRIRSAVSVIIPYTPAAAADHVARPALKRHRSQHYHSHGHGHSAHRRSNSHTQLATLSTFTAMSPPISPSVRRNSTASHPDITRLTLVYKPQSSHAWPP